MLTTGVVYRISGVTIAGALCGLHTRFSSIALFPMIGETLSQLSAKTSHGNPWVYLHMAALRERRHIHIWNEGEVVITSMDYQDSEELRQCVQMEVPSYLILMPIVQGRIGIYLVCEKEDGTPNVDKVSYVTSLMYEVGSAEPCDISKYNAILKQYKPYPTQSDYNSQLPIPW